ncbi:MAG: FHA domain-containing protein [Kofleriaceae bacterium]|nr:FHA domain-containing protein [Kofleriaceae bacterium]
MSRRESGRGPTEARRTRTLPEMITGAFYEGPDIVTSLKLYEAGSIFDLPRDKATFTLGSAASSDIYLPDEGLSKLHCVIERRGQVIRVYDQESKNGTFFNGRKEKTFDLRPGATFTVGATRLLALNDEMRTAYPTLVEIVGEENARSPRIDNASASDLIGLATSSAHVLITADVGCDQDRLARTLHEISLLRSRPYLELARVPDDRAQQRAILDRVSRSTLILPLQQDAPVMDAAFVSMLFSPHFHVRVIATAPSLKKASNVLTESNVRAMRNITLYPLAYRAGSIDHLLDRMFGERGTPLRTSDLSEKNQSALRAYSWPGNFDELRRVADRLTRLAAIPGRPTLRQAAEALGMSSHRSLDHWLGQLGLTLPIVATDERATE